MANAPPYVTVAMITYNHVNLIADAVRSILEQTYDNFELVIIDDGSTDGTGDVIHGFSDPRIRYIWQENMGPSEARNAALRESRGAVIAQMSGDDIAEPTRLECQLDSHSEYPNSLIFSHCIFVDDSGARTQHPTLERRFNRPNWGREATLRYLFLRGNCFLAPSALATRRLFRDVGEFNPVLLQLQDYDMWVRFLLRGYDTYIVQEPLLRYRLRACGGNLSSDSREVRNRGNFERRRVLREFLFIDRADSLAAIFPEIATFGYPLSDELSAFLLAKVALQEEFRHSWNLGAFGADLMMGLMEDVDKRKVILNQAGFRNADLYKLLGEISFRDADMLELRIHRLETQLNDMLQSRTWRLTKPFRILLNAIRKRF